MYCWHYHFIVYLVFISLNAFKKARPELLSLRTFVTPYWLHVSNVTNWLLAVPERYYHVYHKYICDVTAVNHNDYSLETVVSIMARSVH
jgi:hypothetical protein